MDYTSLKLPKKTTVTVDAQQKWLKLLKEAKILIEDDNEFQRKAAGGLAIKERDMVPEVIGRYYIQYVQLVNKMYDCYLNNVQLQRSNYIMELLKVFLKRLYELRWDLVHYIIVNDYIYLDAALTQLRLIPENMEVIVPYHFPLEFRKDSMETLLQKMWHDAVKRQLALVKKRSIAISTATFGQLDADEDDDFPAMAQQLSENNNFETPPSVHSVIPEEYIQALVIQKHERARKAFVLLTKEANARHRFVVYDPAKVAPEHMRHKGAIVIQMVYREYMKLKRLHYRDLQRDILLGIIPKAVREGRKFKKENEKLYEKRRDKRRQIYEDYIKDMEKEKVRLYFIGKDQDQIDDISVHIREWFREWYLGYGFFPQYPYDTQGGTILVIRGDFISIEEKIEADEKAKAATKGKTSEQIKQEKAQAANDKKMKEELEKEKMRKEAENLFKMRCNPPADPGYQPRQAEINIVEALNKYYSTWNYYDELDPEKFMTTVYGYMKPFLTEDLMSQLHQDCRPIVDEFMRLELKLLIVAQQAMFKRVGMKYPKIKPQPKPKIPPAPKVLVYDDNVRTQLEPIFDIEIVTKPKTKLADVLGDTKYGAYEMSIQDPKATFLPPGYGDVRQRLVLSCINGMGFVEGPKRLKSVLLIGPPCNGKSFLVDAVCGEINAVKLDLSPEVFNVRFDKPAKFVSKVFLTARLFQPAVIFLKNIERVFCKKVLPEDKHLRAKVTKSVLVKLVKAISPDDKIIFIATSSNPLAAKRMASLFNEMFIIPVLDYGTLRDFFYYKLQSINSVPRDYCVQSISKILQGYGFGTIMRLFNDVMTAERIVRLNITPLSPFEFLEPLMEEGLEPMSIEDYMKMEEWFVKNSNLSKERAQYDIINEKRAKVYEKMAEKEQKDKEKQEKANKN